jgi:signal transduction histidine kinase/CheY-like chemotaxis protein
MTHVFTQFFNLSLLIFCLIIGAGAASAQPQSFAPIISKPFAGTILNHQSAAALLENNFYVIPDPNRDLSPRVISDKIVTGAYNNFVASSPLVNLGNSGVTTWLVFPITNVSGTELWELDFGGMSAGRNTFMSRISIYSSFFNKIVIDSTPQGQDSHSISQKVNLTLPVGQSGFLIAELRSPAGSTPLLDLSLKKISTTAREVSITATIVNYTPLIAAVILFAAFIIKRKLSYGAFGAAWSLLYLYSYLIDNYIFISGISPGLPTPSLWMLAAIIFTFALWLSDQARALPTSFFAGLGLLSLICGLAGLLISDSLPMIGQFLSYGPILTASLLMIFIGLIMGARGYERIFFVLILSGLLLMCGIGLTVLATFVTIESKALINSAEIMLALSAASCALFALFRSIDPQNYIQSNEADAAVLPNRDLAEAKESSEHKRLIQVLDQERATMAQMQVQEARRTEEMRKAKEAADEANNAKSAFLAVVSHEIRTPMTGIMGMVRLLLDTALSKDQKEYANTIQDSGEALMALLNDILDFEKIESGKLELEHTDFDLHRLLRGVQTLMNGHANSKGIELQLELDPKVPAHIVGDPTRLRQILLNLVNNAIKFTTSKGTVYIRIKDLTPDDKLEGLHQIYFAVQDSGIGITPEVQKKLFMPFAQADSSTTRKYGGTGLGLAICKRLIEVMGGAINISSKPGEGATFFFTLSLPLGQSSGVLSSFSGAASAAGPVDSMSLTPLDNKKLQILVVDDNGINQKVLSGLIEKDGHTVITASTGAEAMGKYLASHYDLVLMDIELPDRNGMQVTDDIRNLRDHAKAFVPVVAMTGNTSEKDVAACFKAGMDDFLAKPINHERLKKIINIASGHGSFANQVQKEIRQHSIAPDITAAPSDNSYVPVPPQTKPFETTYIPQPPSALPPTDLPKTPAFSFDLGNETEDEDTFASAIRHFENIEAQGVTLDSDLDEAMLMTLKNSLTVTQLAELLEGFYEKAEELVTSIGQSYLQRDLEALAARAHELKGMAGNFGFKGVSDLSGQIEKAAKENIEANLKSPVEHLAETYAVSKSKLTTWMAQ